MRRDAENKSLIARCAQCKGPVHPGPCADWTFGEVLGGREREAK